jgi:Transposase IS116/IS110/IS902 family
MTGTPILAIDLGKYKCVACAYDRAAAEYRTVTTSRAEVERLIRGRARRKQAVVALAGSAPFAADSGRYTSHRHIRGGRREVRRVLYLAALAASRVPGPLRGFALRLRANGKPSKVVLVAVARKVLVIAIAVIRDGRAWEPKLAAA